MNAVLQRRSASMPAPLDALGRPLRDLRLSVIEACNFRCPYCMPDDRVPDDHGLDAASRLSFDEIETLVRGFVRLGVRKLRLTGGEPLLRKGLPELVARLAAIDGIDDLALTTNGSLLARHAQRLARRRAAADHGQPRCAGSAVVPRAVRRARRGRRRAGRASPRRRRPASRRSSSTAWSSAASTKTRCCRWSSTSAARPRAALHRVHGRGHLQRLAPRARGAVAPSCATASHARWPLRPLDPQLPRRGGGALRVRRRRRRSRLRQLGQRAVLRRLPPRPRVGRRQALHLPVRGARARRCGPRWQQRRGRRWPSASPRVWRAAPTATASCAASAGAVAQAGRDVPDGRLKLRDA